jgi:hypothetical protein
MKKIESIEVTKEMIEAGWEVLFAFEPGFDDRRETVIKIYRAMETARIKGSPADAGE